MKKITSLGLTVLILTFLNNCTQESQNKLSRKINNWTGIDGVLEIYSGGKLMKKFIQRGNLKSL